jgi:hypothetical protein
MKKFRIIKEGELYYPQVKVLFFWRYFDIIYDYIDTDYCRSFKSIEDAINYVDEKAIKLSNRKRSIVWGGP